MRESIALISLVLILLSCKKDLYTDNQDFKKIEGVWYEQNGDAASSYEFKKNGIIIFQQGIERGMKIRTDRLLIDEIFNLNNGWICFCFQSKRDGNRNFYLSPTLDTLWDAGTLLDSNSVRQQTKQYYTKIQ
jgi:hypothetical protein